MYFLLIFFGLTQQCFIEAVNNVSKVEIKKDFNIVKTNINRERSINKLFKYSWENNDIDSRIIAISYVESRLNVNIHSGDKGKACGTFQIHARYSYPMFRRKRGFVNWKEKENKIKIKSECKKLKRVKYSVKTMKKLLYMMDKRDLHPCHHNSGFYGKCNTWYKQRIDFIYNYLETSKVLCKNNSKLISVEIAAKIYKAKFKLLKFFKSLF